MKYYLFQAAIAVACVFMLIYRPFPGWGAFGAAWLVWLCSIVFTAYGVKQMVDDMWWRIAMSVGAFLIIGIGGAS